MASRNESYSLLGLLHDARKAKNSAYALEPQFSATCQAYQDFLRNALLEMERMPNSFKPYLETYDRHDEQYNNLNWVWRHAPSTFVYHFLNTTLWPIQWRCLYHQVEDTELRQSLEQWNACLSICHVPPPVSPHMLALVDDIGVHTCVSPSDHAMQVDVISCVLSVQPLVDLVYSYVAYHITDISITLLPKTKEQQKREFQFSLTGFEMLSYRTSKGDSITLSSMNLLPCGLAPLFQGSGLLFVPGRNYRQDVQFPEISEVVLHLVSQPQEQPHGGFLYHTTWPMCPCWTLVPQVMS